MKLKEAINKLRGQESIEPIFVLRNSKNCAVLLAWKYLSPPIAECDDADPNDWGGLWENVSIDYSVLSRMADLSEGECRLIVERLREFRLIYPDGTVTEPAEKYLRATTQKHLNELKR